MADLIARGGETHQHWQHTLTADPVTLGRVAGKSIWTTPWDSQVSSTHATLSWREGKLFVRRAQTARNPIFFQGEDQQLAEFAVAVGESFVIGGTSFSVVETLRPTAGDLTPDAEMTFSPEELRGFKFIDANERFEVLAALPEVIRYSPSDEELERRVVEVLLRGIPRAGAAAVVQFRPTGSGADPLVTVRSALASDRSLEPVQPSRRLVADAIGTRRQSVLYRWGQRDGLRRASDYTVQEGIEWALCVPLPDDPSPGWGLYVAGRNLGGVLEDSSQQALLKSDLKFAELVADIFGSLRQVRDLQRRQAQLARFLSRPVLTEIAQRDIDEVLVPREAEVTVLFCDLRGSCRISEEGKGDLRGLWGRVSAALGIMTGNITDVDGVIGDFQGDAAMGFWGWPLACSDPVERAARAALGIRRDFQRLAQEAGNPLAGFACGIGIASGPAFAGKLGTYDQFKVGVFGPVVNLASRLESMTKQFQVSILLDERSAQVLAGARTSHWCRCRRLARVRPAGMTAAEAVSELLPSEVEPGAMKERERRDYEAALEAFQSGRWPDVDRLLRHLPPGDGPSKFLRGFMQGRTSPPAGWDGVIQLQQK